jgi:pyruvate ferredoxin oxidoreductase alpha subunit
VLTIHAETCQEVLDSILMAYRIAEDAQVLLPVIVNLDGFYLSFTREAVAVPGLEQVRAFLPAYAPSHAHFSASHPMAQGVAVLGGTLYSFFKYQTHLAARNALPLHDEVATQFGAIFGRHYGLVEGYQLDDAEYVLVMSNAFATKGKAAIKRFRAQGKRVGLLRLRVLRPFPRQAIVTALEGRKAVAVIDQNLSIGCGGITYAEVCSALYGTPKAPPLLSYVGGLGGKDISTAEFDHILSDLQDSAATGQAKPTRLLYTDREDAQMAAFCRLLAKGGGMSAAETRYKNIKDLAREEFILPGTPVCAGCGGLRSCVWLVRYWANG